MKTGTVYKITNIVNNKMYIGQTTETLRRRMVRHRSKSNNGSNAQLHIDMRKYGADKFTIKALATTDEDLLLAVESAYIDMFDTYNTGYNMTVGGVGTVGRKHTDKTKAKMSKARKGKKRNPLSAEHKAKLSSSQKGKKRGPKSAEQKAKMSAAQKARYARIKNAAS